MTAASNMTNLWDRVRQGDTAAMVLLYEQFYAGLLSYGVQLSNSNETAQDAINDVFLNIWDSRSKLKSVENVKAYLFACIRRNIFRSTVKKRQHSLLQDDTNYPFEQSDPTHEDVLVAMQESDEIRQKVQKALEKLTERQKELIQMKYFKGMDYRQIEIETGISMKTAYNTVYNAMKILTNELQDILLSLISFFLLF